MPKPYPTEFRDDVLRVARNREPGVTIEQIAKDFGVHPMTLQKWLQRAAVDDGAKPGQSRTDSVLQWPQHRALVLAETQDVGERSSDHPSRRPRIYCKPRAARVQHVWRLHVKRNRYQLEMTS